MGKKEEEDEGLLVGRSRDRDGAKRASVLLADESITGSFLGLNHQSLTANAFIGILIIVNNFDILGWDNSYQQI